MREDRGNGRQQQCLANPTAVTLPAFATLEPRTWGIGEVLSLQVRDEQALFVPLLAFFANWTLANRKFLGQIFPLRVF